jgi:hypothetical protein
VLSLVPPVCCLALQELDVKPPSFVPIPTYLSPHFHFT